MKDVPYPADTAIVTIGMPVYENGRTLDRAISSVLGQSFQDWVLLISDDQSSDQTSQIAQEAAARDPRIRFVRNSERLGFMNFKQALISADTPYFVWLAGDDFWHADFLSQTVAALDAAPSAVSAMPQARFVGGNGKPIPNLGFLEGTDVDRLKSYFAHPGGTRMYGLMRTEAAQASFPAKSMNAYDWYFMATLLGLGPQLPVTSCLLFREETQWIDYAQMADRISERTLYKQFPILEMSLALIRDRKIPLGAVPALLSLNRRKRDEFLAVCRPEAYLRSLARHKLNPQSIARSPTKMGQIAQHLQAIGKTDLAEKFAAHGPRETTLQAPAKLDRTSVFTAILTCRNAAGTLPAWLDHIDEHGGKVIFIDHGSNDETLSVAQARSGALITDIIEHPFLGYFDLTQQLEMKRRIIGALPGGWIMHADADEFVDPPDGTTIEDLLTQATRCGKIAIASEEHIYLPMYEDEEHDPDTFVSTLQVRAILNEHDQKQRLFHSQAPLDVWLRTGGHTVSRDPDDVLEEPTRLRHYPGLSLDDLRAQYHARVFAERDIRKLWHGSRKASRNFDIVPPNCALFTAEPEAAQVLPHAKLPVFREAKLADKAISVAPSTQVLFIAATPCHDALSDVLGQWAPGLVYQIVEGTPDQMSNRSIPVMNITTHPAHIHDTVQRRSNERAKAVAWVQRIASARQTALEHATPYIELRLEDIQGTPSMLIDAMKRLHLGRPVSGTSGFISQDAQPIEKAFHTPVRTITAPLAADLGYR